MIELELEQGTPEWHQARLGIPTASMMKSIITSTGKPSTSASTYMYQLLADIKAGHPVDAFEGNKFTEIGTERERDSRALYELITGNEVREVGFVFLDEEKSVGCSPDGLVDDDGLVEFKNPKASTLMKYAFDNKLPTDYKVQVQAQLWITGRRWCDFVAHHPEIGHWMITVYRDEKFIETMAGLVGKFNEELKEKTPLVFKIFQ